MSGALTKAEILLFIQHYHDVYRAVYMYCGDKYRAEDAVQEGFYLALKNIGQLKCYNRFTAWVTTIAINELKKQYRKDNQVINICYDELNVKLFDHERFSEIETKEDLRVVLSQLDEPHRQAFILFYYFDVPLNEIAEMLRVSNGTIKTRLYYARKKIRKLMDDRSVTMEASNE